MPDTADVIIAGGGVMGCSIAYHLARDADFDGRIVVVERDPTYQSATTPRSMGGVRAQFSLDENIAMHDYNIAMVRNASDWLAVEGDTVDLAFREQGYLVTASASGRDALAANVARQQAAGKAIVLLDAGELTERFAWLRTDDLAAGAFGERDEGWIDPNALMQAFRRKARSLGVTFLHDEVVGVTRDGARIAGVELKSDERLDGPVLVNAAGTRAGALARLAGADLPVEPRKRMVFVFECRTDLSGAPLTFDPSGVAFRPETRGYVGTFSPPEDRDPAGDPDDFSEDWHWWDDPIWPALAHRVPAFEAVKTAGAWSCYYEFNTFDHNGLLGPHPQIEGLHFCNGFSGHGLQQSPSAGRAVAERIVHGEYRSLDLSGLDYCRYLEGRRMLETNIY